MKIQVHSDLHRESRLDYYRVYNPVHRPLSKEETDVIVLAGDITNFPGRFALHHELTRVEKPIIYVPGNHEYYGTSDVRLVVPELKELYRGTNVHVLDRDAVTIGDVTFIGATLWSDLSNPLNARVVYNYLNDFRVHGLTLDWYQNQHVESRTYIQKALKVFYGNGKKRVVVTHHGCHPGSTHPRYEGHPANAGFITDLSEIILAEQPELWIHGHVHDPFDYMVEDTRIIVNPKGYPGEAKKRTDSSPYNERLIVEI